MAMSGFEGFDALIPAKTLPATNDLGAVTPPTISMKLAAEVLMNNTEFNGENGMNNFERETAVKILYK